MIWSIPYLLLCICIVLNGPTMMNIRYTTNIIVLIGEEIYPLIEKFMASMAQIYILNKFSYRFDGIFLNKASVKPL